IRRDGDALGERDRGKRSQAAAAAAAGRARQRGRRAQHVPDGRGAGRAAPVRGVRDYGAAGVVHADPHARAQADGHAGANGRERGVPHARGDAAPGARGARGGARGGGAAVLPAGGHAVLWAAARRAERGRPGRGRAARAAGAAAAAQDQERRAPAAQGGDAADHRQGARVWRGGDLQPGAAAADGAGAGGPGAAPAGQGDRPRDAAPGRSGAPVCAQDPGRDRAHADRRGPLRARRGLRGDQQSEQGRGAAGHDCDHAPRHRPRRRVRAQHHCARAGRCCVGAGRAGSAAVSAGRVPEHKVVAGAPDRDPRGAPDSSPGALGHPAAPARARRLHRARAGGRAPARAHRRCAGPGRARRGRGAVRHRVVRRGAQAAVAGHPPPPQQGPGRLPQGHRLYHPADGRRVRQPLHARGHGHPHPRVPVARRVHEEHRAQGRQAVRVHPRRPRAVHQGRGAARVLPVVLGAPHGARPPPVLPGRRDDRRARGQGRRRRDCRPHRAAPQGRVGHVPQHGYGGDQADHREPRRAGHRGPPGGAADGRRALRVPGAGRRGADDAGRVRRRRQRAGHARQAVPAAGDVGAAVAAQQPEPAHPAAGGGSGGAAGAGHAGVRRGRADGARQHNALRVPGRGVPRGAGFDPRRAGRDRQRNRDGGDAAADRRPAPAADADSQEPPREGAGELHRPGRAHRRPRGRVCERARVDAQLLQPARPAARQQKGHPPRGRQHVWLYRPGHRPAGRAGDAAQQSQGAGAPEPRVHHRGHRHRRRDLRALHRAARPDERVPRARAQRAERRAQVAVLSVRVHWPHRPRLRQRRDPAARGRPGRPRPGPPPAGRVRRQAPGPGRRRPRQRGPRAAPPQLSVAQHLRDQPPLHLRRARGHRVVPPLPRPRPHRAVHAPGPVPPRPQGPRRLLAHLQHDVPGLAARPRCLLPPHRGHRCQHLPPLRARLRHL
ncbi:hypothetical protein H4R21_003228, partial [Coemansia helicoidea]